MDSTHNSADRQRRTGSSKDHRVHSSASTRAGSSAKKVSHGLVALSSAAIVAVYTAGFLRTRPAAARLEAASQRRFPAPVQATVSAAPPGTTVTATAGAAAVPAVSQPGPGVSLAVPTTPREERGPERSRSGGNDSPAASGKSESAVATIAPAVALPAGASTSSTVAPAAPSSTPAPAAQAAAAPPSLSGVPSGDRTIADALAALPPVAAAPAGQYKDGTYSGWGSCRHGDIEATVVVEGGRITVSRISMCLTRYSCSWISPLPPQVIARQSQNVDYVSGATDSAIAFYDAIGEALRKAK